MHHGRIVTVDRAFSIAEAMAVREGRILRVGSDGDVLALKGPNTEMVDLAGKMVLPGLIDSHAHPLAASLVEFDHPIPQMDSVSDVLDYFAARARAVPEGQWLTLRQVFITRLREQRYPTRTELDRAAPKHPVVFATGPDAMFNSLGLRRNSIDRNYRIPDGGPGLLPYTCSSKSLSTSARRPSVHARASPTGRPSCRAGPSSRPRWATSRTSRASRSSTRSCCSS